MITDTREAVRLAVLLLSHYQAAPLAGHDAERVADLLRFINPKTKAPRIEDIARYIQTIKRAAPQLLDDDFGTAEPLVQAVLENERTERKSGRITGGVVVQLRQSLCRARAEYGFPAMVRGLELSANKGLGVAYAVGCMRSRGRRGESDTAPTQHDRSDDLQRLVMPART